MAAAEPTAGGFSTRRRVFSLLLRWIAGVYFSLTCFGFWQSFRETGKWTALGWMISEGVVVVLFVFRRDTALVSRRPLDWFLGATGVLIPLLVRPAPSILVPDVVGVALQFTGVAIGVSGKVALGRSFGVIAANRGVVRRGAYRVVRHPIYLGYCIAYLGFLLANWSTRNVAIYAVTYALIVGRILVEERYLLRDQSYVRYSQEVTSRLVPGVF